MRKRIKKPEFTTYGINVKLIVHVQNIIKERGYGNKRVAWWYDCGMIYATVNNYGSECTVYRDWVLYSGQN